MLVLGRFLFFTLLGSFVLMAHVINAVCAAVTDASPAQVCGASDRLCAIYRNMHGFVPKRERRLYARLGLSEARLLMLDAAGSAETSQHRRTVSEVQYALHADTV